MIGIRGEMLHPILMFQGEKAVDLFLFKILEFNKSPFITIIYFPFTASLIYIHSEFILFFY